MCPEARETRGKQEKKTKEAGKESQKDGGRKDVVLVRVSHEQREERQRERK